MHKKWMIKIAKEAIREVLLGRVLVDKKALLLAHPSLMSKAAVFVTLQKRERLRGCIGSLSAHRTLLNDIIANAQSAAFHDPRFPPLTLEEFNGEDFIVEISLLSEPKELRYQTIQELQSRVRVGVDGVILQLGDNHATFLPQVWKQLPDFDDFFAHLCQKAGLQIDCLVKHPKIFLYQVEKIEE